MGGESPERALPVPRRSFRGQRTLRRQRRPASLSGLRGAVQRSLDSGAFLALILDFDGTLTPIVPRPDSARLDPRARSTLRTLVTHPRIGVAVLSGRSLPDIKRRISLRGVIYGGSHGLEIEGPRLRFRSPSARGFERRLRLAGSALEALVGAVPGAELERKRFAVAVHYRRVARWRLRALGDMVRRAADEHGLALLKGKKVWDVVPPGLGGKSQGVSLIQEYFKRRARRRETVMLYFGDDATDLEAFRRLRQGAISVQVGGRSGAAAFRLRGVSEVHALLRWIETAIARESGGPVATNNPLSAS